METKILETSRRFWSVMEQADEAGMRGISYVKNLYCRR